MGSEKAQERKIVFFCSASFDIDDKYNQAAREATRAACSLGYTVVSGGTVKGKPKKVDIEFSFENSSDSIYPTEDDICKLDIVDTKVTKTDDTFCAFSGDVVNNTKKQFEFGTIYIIFKNDKGEILGGNDIYLDKIKFNGVSNV